MKKKDTLTIPQVARQLNKTTNTIYRYIKSNKLKYEYVVISGKKVIRIKESELIRFCNAYDISRYNVDTSEDMLNDISEDNKVITPDISEQVKEAVNNALSLYHKDFLEQVFNAGLLTRDNQFLKERVEVLHNENIVLQDNLRALPDLKTIEEKEKDLITQIELERQEKADLLSMTEEQKKNTEELHRQDIEKVKNEVEQAKQESLTVLQLQITDLQREKETLLLQVEQEKKDIIEECKRQLEEYMNKPFWKKLW